MAKNISLTTICFLLLTLTLGIASAARQLNEGSTMFTPADELPSLPSVDESTSSSLPSGQAPAAASEADDSTTAAPLAAAPEDDSTTTTTTAAAAAAPEDDTPATEESTTTAAPAAAAPADDTPADDAKASAATAAGDETPATDDSKATPAPGAAASAAGSAAGGAEQPGHPTISFFMHDVLGGSSASGRIVTGLIATSDVNGIPFSRPNNQVFPVSNGVPLMNNANLLNNNNVPFLAGLTGQNQPRAQTIIQNAGTNSVVSGGNNQAFVTPGQLPTGAALQKLLFGSITVIDDELTEGHELGAGLIGRGQGFYLASSLDGESHTMAFTAVFHPQEHNHGEEDTLSFFGVHRTASPISQMAIIGGTGKYENAKGYTTIETLPQQDQHTTDGVDTVAKFTVYLTSEKN